MENLKTPGYLITDQADLFYATGVPLSGFWLLLTRREAITLAPRLLADHVRSLVDTEVIASDNLINALFAVCKEKRIRTLGVDPGEISYFLAEKFSKNLSLSSQANFIAQLRQIKDDEEIKLIKKSCTIAHETVEFARKLVRPGMAEYKIALKIEEHFIKRGVRQSFPTIVASGPNSANPHHISGSRTVKKDDIVLIDLGCVYKGYCSDLTRTFFFGKINRLSEKIYSLVAEAKSCATRATRSGKEACEIDRAAREVIRQGGFEREFIHSTGHGVGIEVHEAPRVNKKDATVLKPGMVITIEPGIYLAGRFGVRLEDTVLVTKNGNEVLTQ